MDNVTLGISQTVVADIVRAQVAASVIEAPKPLERKVVRVKWGDKQRCYHTCDRRFRTFNGEDWLDCDGQRFNALSAFAGYSITFSGGPMDKEETEP